MARTVLVADDSPTIQRRASGILTGEGLEVVTVSNGVAAIKKLPAIKPLVVLADVSMPGRDGYEVCQFVKQSADFKHVPVVLVFSDDEPYEETRGAQAGADGRIKKPFDSDELVKTVSRMAAKAEAATASPQVVAPPPAPAQEPFAGQAEAEAEAFPQQETAAVSRPVEPEVSSVPEGIAFEQLGQEGASPVAGQAIPAFAPEAVEPAGTFGETTFVAEPAETEFREAPLSGAAAEPELAEESLATHEPEEDHAHPHLHEQGGFFHAPEEIAEPVLLEELESPAPGLEAPPEAAAEFATETESAILPPPEAQAAVEETAILPPAAAIPAEPEQAAAALETEPAPAVQEPEGAQPAAQAAPLPAAAESAEAATAFATPSVEGISEPAPAAEPETAATAQAAAEHAETAAPSPSPARLDAEQIFDIVHRVVVKMSPAAMPPSVVEEIARRIADEVIAESGL